MNIRDFKELKKTISYRMGAFNCSRCGREEHIPSPSIKELESMGIYSWTLFLSHYIRYKAGWTILYTPRGEYVCPYCKNKDDVINEGKSEIFNEWFKKYQEWLKQNKLI